MKILHTFVLFLFATAQGEEESGDDDQAEAPEKDRKGKIFSLFNVVQFRNTVCAVTGGTARIRNGTCLSQAECTERGGNPRSNCASGFGVCCLFVVQDCGSNIRENCTYIQNPGFPTPYRVLTPCSYTIQKCSNSVCRLRLDFEMFTTFEPAGTTETDDGGVCNPRWDQFSIQNLNTGNPMNTVIPVICGENTGQHMYIDIGDQPSDTATLNFIFRQMQRDRVWDIKVTQVVCNSISDPPQGCLQYLTGTSGRFTSFNFNILSSQHLGNQNYRICIRRKAGMCCVVYTPCANKANSFSVGGTNQLVGVDTHCLTDYITIPNASSSCNGKTLSQRFCGSIGVLGFFINTKSNTEVCSCSSPFEFGFISDNTKNPNDNVIIQRGFCMDYRQVPCNAAS